MVVVAAVQGRQFGDRRAAEFTAPQDQRGIEHAALLQISQQRRDRLVPLFGKIAMVLFQIIVIVPRLAGAAPDLNESYTPFQQPPRGEQLPGMNSGTVHFVNVFRFLAHVEHVHGFALHAIRQFERLNAGFQLRVCVTLGKMRAVQSPQQIQLPALFGQRQPAVFDVGDQFPDVGLLGVDVRPLAGSGQKR